MSPDWWQRVTSLAEVAARPNSLLGVLQVLVRLPSQQTPVVWLAKESLSGEDEPNEPRSKAHPVGPRPSAAELTVESRAQAPVGLPTHQALGPARHSARRLAWVGVTPVRHASEPRPASESEGAGWLRGDKKLIARRRTAAEAAAALAHFFAATSSRPRRGAADPTSYPFVILPGGQGHPSLPSHAPCRRGPGQLLLFFFSPSRQPGFFYTSL